MASIISAGTTSGTSLNLSGDTSGVLQLASNGSTTAVTIDTNQRAAFVAGTAALPAITTTGDTNTGIFFPAADTIAFAEGGAEAMRIDSSGYVGIGSTNPQQRFQVQGTTAQTRISVDADGTSLQFWKDATPTFVGAVGLSTPGNSDQSAIVFSTYSGSWAESMRINSSGQLLVGTTSASSFDGGFRCFPTGSGNSMQVIISNTGGGLPFLLNRSDDGNIIDFRRAGSNVGTVSVTTSATSYNTSSDYRLKENIAPMTGALAKVAQLKPVTYTWKATGETSQGFIAHELQAIVPDCVTGEKDAVDEEGNPVHQGVDTSFLVATLTAAIQELKAELDATKAEVQALKGTL